MVNETEKAECLRIASDVMNNSSFKDIEYNPRNHTFSMSMIVLCWEFFVHNNMSMDYFLTRSRIALFAGVIKEDSILFSLEVSGRELFRDIQVPICEGMDDTVPVGYLIKGSILAAGKIE